MKLSYILFLGFIIFNCCRTKNANEISTIKFSSEKDWKYFDLEKPIFVKIISHLPTNNLCGTMAFASITIAETDKNDTIRILDLCGSNINYHENDYVKITPTKKPDFAVIFPYRMMGNSKTKKKVPFELDIKTLKTTYGNISKQIISK